MANLYTKTGDKGQTSLVGGSRVSKADLRVECYGTVDEMSSALGMARALSDNEFVKKSIKIIQGRLFALGAELASDEQGRAKLKSTIREKDVAFLESVSDHCTEINGLQKNFVIPGENPPSAALHVARTIVRRAERAMIRLNVEQGDVREEMLRYINRLSDATFAMARLEETMMQQEALRVKVEEEVRRQMGLQEKGPLTLAKAQEMAVKAVQKAEEMKVPVVFTVVDEGGNLILLHRMERAFLGSVSVSTNKAFTANAFQMPTDVLGSLAQPGAPLYGIETSNEGKIVLFGGGFPYKIQGKTVGAVGVSGGTVEEDMAIATFALGEE